MNDDLDFEIIEEVDDLCNCGDTSADHSTETVDGLVFHECRRCNCEGFWQ